MNKHGRSPLVRIRNAFFYSLDGLRACYQSEQAFRQELLLCLFLFILSCFASLTLLEYAIIILSIFLVLIAELLNSGIEAIVDWISLEQHSSAKKAKDVASAAVFLSLANLAVVWLLLVVL